MCTLTSIFVTEQLHCCSFSSRFCPATATEDVDETGAIRGVGAKPQVDRSLAEGDHVKVTSRTKSVDIRELFDESKVTRIEPKQRKRSSAASTKSSTSGPCLYCSL